jgi:adenylosuccinate synthase
MRTAVLRSARVVIGAGYGDEGKGLMTDAFAALRPSRVVRFNGGAQAGHTVTTPDGRRHVFHHVGAGALAGAPTHLSRFFLVNPLLLRDEIADLKGLGAQVEITVDPQAPTTTPYDMLINQVAERARGEGRHGSCGLGIGETVARSLRDEFRLLAGDLRDEARTARIVGDIRARWVPARLSALGVEPTSAEAAVLADERVLDAWMADVAAFNMTCEAAPAPDDGRDLIFEGAQGLMLDQDRGAFPFVTRSNTGLRNALTLARDMGVVALEACYVTRAYVTRHGAGPLAHEWAQKPERLTDLTNQPNAWQGTLRFAPLDLEVLSAAIRADFSDLAETGIAARLTLAVTHLDQAAPSLPVFDAGLARDMEPEGLAALATARVGAEATHLARGPTRAAVELADFMTSL